MLPGKRSRRVGDLILKEVAFLLLEKVRDPRVRGVTLTGIDLSNDLRMAKIHYSVMGDPDAEQDAAAGLRSATGFVKGQIGKRLKLRYVPDISFSYDPSLKFGNYMERLFEGMRRSDDD